MNVKWCQNCGKSGIVCLFWKKVQTQCWGLADFCSKKCLKEYQYRENNSVLEEELDPDSACEHSKFGTCRSVSKGGHLIYVPNKIKQDTSQLSREERKKLKAAKKLKAKQKKQLNSKK